MISFYQHLPLSINPIAFTIGSFSVRWYAISYLVGFLIVYLILMWRIKNEEIKLKSSVTGHQSLDSSDQWPVTSDKLLVLDFLLVTFFAALVGGRVGYVLLYNFAYYRTHILEIFLPYQDRKLIGFYGMSYHGALLAILLASWIFAKVKKINFWAWSDFVIPAVPFGYFFGRVGNFFNGELYGRVTTSPMGMYFTSDKENLRYPSQLIEASLEGLLLFLFLWTVRNKKFAKGKMLSLYLMGYGMLRTISEIFREPDPQLGFIFAGITLGQILSMAMIIMGALLYLKLKRKVLE